MHFHAGSEGVFEHCVVQCGGRAPLEPENRFGGMIIVDRGASVTFRNCVIKGSHTAALCARSVGTGEPAAVVMENCIVEGNNINDNSGWQVGGYAAGPSVFFGDPNGGALNAFFVANEVKDGGPANDPRIGVELRGSLKAECRGHESIAALA